MGAGALELSSRGRGIFFNGICHWITGEDIGIWRTPKEGMKDQCAEGWKGGEDFLEIEPVSQREGGGDLPWGCHAGGEQTRSESATFWVV